MTSRRFNSRATHRQRLMASAAYSVSSRSRVGWDLTATHSSTASFVDCYLNHSLTGSWLLDLKTRRVSFSEPPQGLLTVVVNPISHSGSSIPRSLVTALGTVYSSPSRSLPNLVMTASGSYDTSSYPRGRSLNDMLRDVLNVDMKASLHARLMGHIKRVSPR